MRLFIPWGIFLGLVYTFQSSLIYPLAFENNSADLVMLTVVFLTIMYGRYPLFYGFIGGMFLDLASGSFVGIHTFALMAICLLIDYLAEFIHRDSILIPLYVGLFITVINHLIMDILIFLLGYSQSYISMIQSLGIDIIYNIIFGYIMWYIMHKIKYFLDKYLSKKLD